MPTLKLTEKTLTTLSIPAGEVREYYWDTELAGFGVVVGRKQSTFVARARVNRKLVKRTIGPAGTPRDADGMLWTVQLARIEARKILGSMADGRAPATRAQRFTGGGMTLGHAFDLHVTRMRANQASASSLATIERERDKYLVDWVDRPLATIERVHCRELHELLTKKHGKYLANRVMRHIRAAWNTALKESDLPANPTIAVHWNKEERRQEPIAWDGLEAWHAIVQKLEPVIVDGERVGDRPGVRGDYQMFVLLTGLRRMDAATVRWKHVDLDEATLHRPNPKGGKDRAFTIPLSRECVKILERRRKENRDLYPDGDGGWVFPTTAIKSKRCGLCAALGMPAHEDEEHEAGEHQSGEPIHLVEGKQQRWNKETGVAERILPSPHRLRDTYTSALAALDPPVSGFVIDVLTNHRPPRGSVTAGYINLGADDLRDAQERVTAFLLEKMKPTPEQRRAKMRRAA